jgi:hypothetical protein
MPLFSSLRSAVALTLAAVVLVAAARFWFITGLVRPVTIDGPSMALAFCGTHYAFRCADCGFLFRCDAEHPPPGGRATCPNCGFGENELLAANGKPRERVLIDRWPFLWRSFQRGEVVAARASADLIVKRVAALPHQRLAIEGGDLYADGAIVRKTLSELRDVRVLVHDNDYQPQRTRGLPPRWKPAAGESGWHAAASGFRIDSAARPGDDIDWLQYQHWPCTANPTLRGALAPVRDNDSYNQGGPARELAAVPDVVLSCRLKTSGTGQLAFAAIDGAARFEVLIESGERVILQRGGQTLIERELDRNITRHDVHVEFGLCDQQVMLAINGVTEVRFPYDRPSGPQAEPLHPLAIGARTMTLEVAQLRVWRDIYYLDPQGLPRAWEATLGAESVVLLGDNSPASIDSRHWEPPGIPRTAILGRVYRAFWAVE